MVESLVYVFVYFRDLPPSFALFRFTVPLLLHMVASFILGFGINQRLLASVRGEVPLLLGSRRFFVAAILLHAAYNVTVTVLDLVDRKSVV